MSFDSNDSIGKKRILEISQDNVVLRFDSIINVFFQIWKHFVKNCPRLMESFYLKNVNRGCIFAFFTLL